MSQAKRNEREIDKKRRVLARKRFQVERRQHLDSVLARVKRARGKA